MAETLSAVERQLDDLRDDKHRHAWLATHIRQRCLENQRAANGIAPTPRLVRAGGEGEPLLEIEAFILARRFATLPEPERSALGLFYIDLFTPEETASLLKMSLEELGLLLDRARLLLRSALQTTPADSAASPEHS